LALYKMPKMLFQSVKFRYKVDFLLKSQRQ
jgi:hypothetical protein